MSCGEVTSTISLSCTCWVRSRPTARWAQTVVVRVCAVSSQVPAARVWNSDVSVSDSDVSQGVGPDGSPQGGCPIPVASPAVLPVSH